MSHDSARKTVDLAFALAAASNVPAKDMKELVAWLKADEKRATFGTPSTTAFHSGLDIVQPSSSSASVWAKSRAVTVTSVDVRYFIETDLANGTQTISVRGTAAKPNVWEDVETALVPDSLLGIRLHLIGEFV